MSGCRNLYLDELNQIAASSDLATRAKDMRYIRTLENQYMCMQRELLQLTTRFANVQCSLRKIEDAKPDEQEDLLSQLESFLFVQLLEHECFRVNHTNAGMASDDDDNRIFGELDDKIETVVSKIRDRLTPLDMIIIEVEEEDINDANEETLKMIESSSILCGKTSCYGRRKKSKDRNPVQEKKSTEELEKTEKLP